METDLFFGRFTEHTSIPDYRYYKTDYRQKSISPAPGDITSQSRQSYTSYDVIMGGIAHANPITPHWQLKYRSI